MNIQYVPSPYFSSRNGKSISGVVIHTTQGFYQGTINYFKNNDRRVSAHYVVSLNGEITRMVDEAQAAHHAGITRNATSPVYKGFNPNWNTVGIENADDNNPQGANRDNQYPVLAKLVADICKRNNIPVDRSHICGHRELYDAKTCPGNLDVDRIVSLAKKELEAPCEISDQTKIPQLDNLEVQAIRSIRNDMMRDLAEKDGKYDRMAKEYETRLTVLKESQEAEIKELTKAYEAKLLLKEPKFSNPFAAFLYGLAKKLG